jgi:hypothetical protein
VALLNHKTSFFFFCKYTELMGQNKVVTRNAQKEKKPKGKLNERI